MVVALPDGNTADAVAAALIDHTGRLPTRLRRSLTWDRGCEMVRHAVITTALSMPVFFCDPHHPWQRGTHENTNRLLRRYLHKERRPVHVHPGRAQRHRRENSTTARVEYSAGPPQPRRSAQPSRNRCSWRPRSRCGSWLRS